MIRTEAATIRRSQIDVSRLALPKAAGLMSAAFIAIAALRIPWHPWVSQSPNWEMYQGGDLLARFLYLPAFWAPMFAAAMIVGVWSGSLLIASFVAAKNTKLSADENLSNMAVFAMAVSVFAVPFVIEATLNLLGGFGYIWMR